MKKFFFLLLMASLANPTFSQNTKDSVDDRFHDDLLDHLVGTWNVSAVAHGFSSTGVITASWVLNHQFFHLHFKGNDTIPWWHMPMEYEQFFGYNRFAKRYTSHGMSIEGDGDPSEGFAYGYRNGNELKTIAKFGSDTSVIQRFTWQPATSTWSIKSTAEIGGKEGNEVFLEMKLVAVKPSSKK
ncbi:MAG: hypothetical protein ABIN01_17500 [Ferruginibacter sp.]